MPLFADLGRFLWRKKSSQLFGNGPFSSGDLSSE